MARSAVPAFIPCHPPLIHHFIDIRQLRPPFHGCFHCRYTFQFSSNRMSSACAVKQNCHCLLLLPVHNPTAAFGAATFPWGRDIYRLPVSLVPLANIAILAPSPFLSPQNKRRIPCDDCPEPPRILFTNPYISRPPSLHSMFPGRSHNRFSSAKVGHGAAAEASATDGEIIAFCKGIQEIFLFSSFHRQQQKRVFIKPSLAQILSRTRPKHRKN